MRGRARTLLAAALLLACGHPLVSAGPARAQTPDPAVEARRRALMSSPQVLDHTLRVIARMTGEGEPEPPAVSQRAMPPLSLEQVQRLRDAISLRRDGLLEPASDQLAPLVRELPHHPLVVTEQARLLLAKSDFAAVERLGRAERAGPAPRPALSGSPGAHPAGAAHDSLLIAREMALALERLGRPREAAQVAVEAWAAEPVESEWASAAFLRLAPTDPRGIRELLRRAAEKAPDRVDLAFGLARLDARRGDVKAALTVLEKVDGPDGPRTPLRWKFAEELLTGGAASDSAAAAQALAAVAGDARHDPRVRLGAARRAWEVHDARGSSAEGAPALARALKNVPSAQWGPDFLLAVARGLRQAGLTSEARALLHGDDAARGTRPMLPEMELEEALADLRDGPPERALPRLRAIAVALPEAGFRYAEALFFAGRTDSALAWYQLAAKDPAGPYTGAALERIYLLEDADPRPALPVFGRIAYAEWRGELRQAAVLTDSLYHALPRGALWAQAALMLSARREAAGDAKAALEPVLAVADSLPDDRLAPLARQRAGDLFFTKLKDERQALAQYEECLARYPKAWNAPEVRRRVEQLRRERRF